MADDLILRLRDTQPVNLTLFFQFIYIYPASNLASDFSGMFSDPLVSLKGLKFHMDMSYPHKPAKDSESIHEILRFI